MIYLSEHFKEIERRTGFPDEAVPVLEAAAARLDNEKKFGAEFEKIRRGYMYGKGRLSKSTDKLEKLAEKYGIHTYTLEFIFLMVCCELLHKQYIKAGISEELFWDGVADLKYKLVECMECEHVVGTFVSGWNDGFLRMNRFALGRFQYEYGKFGMNYTSRTGVKIKKGQDCLNFHIPSSGVPLTDEIREDSYKKAYEFFKDIRTPEGYLILNCGSWLLFPKHEEYLDPNSNIMKFYREFEIYEWKEKDEFNDDWRIWGHYSDLPLEERPADTKLRAAYKKWMMAGNKTGYGCGIIILKDGKPLK